MRRQSVPIAGVLLLAWVGAAGAEVIVDPSASTEASSTDYYASPVVPSIVFVSPEARDSAMGWLPNSTPFIPRPPLLLQIQPQPNSPVIINRPAPLGGFYPHPPNSVVASANLAAAHAYKFGASDPVACPASSLWNFRVGLGAFFPLGTNCWLGPYVPLVAGPPGFNRPTDRLPNAANAARAVDRAHNYRFGN